MEKRETRIKCTGCGSTYKLRVPVTDKPVSFKCKKCGKVLKFKVKSASKATAPSGPPSPPRAPTSVFDTIQASDQQNFADPGAAPSVPATPSSVGSHTFDQGPAPTGGGDETDKQWVVLAQDEVKGPFADEEISAMIQRGEVGPETSLRMGERPWVKAAELSEFRDQLGGVDISNASRPLPSIKMPDSIHHEGQKIQQDQGPLFYEQVPGIMSYPLGSGNWQPLAIFFGIAFVLSAVLSFHFRVGLPVNILGWMVLYGYLTTLMQTSEKFPDNPPPPWNFGKFAEMGLNGVSVFIVLLVYSLVPVGISLVLMIMFFLNAMTMLGYLFMVVTVGIFVASMFVIPASLVILQASQNVGLALSPAGAMMMIKKGGRPYLMLAAISVATGLACLCASIIGVLVSDITGAGFVPAGLVLAAVFSYGHFIWFHVLGRFSKENAALTNQVVSGVPT